MVSEAMDKKSFGIHLDVYVFHDKVADYFLNKWLSPWSSQGKYGFPLNPVRNSIFMWCFLRKLPVLSKMRLEKFSSSISGISDPLMPMNTHRQATRSTMARTTINMVGKLGLKVYALDPLLSGYAPFQMFPLFPQLVASKDKNGTESDKTCDEQCSEVKKLRIVHRDENYEDKLSVISHETTCVWFHQALSASLLVGKNAIFQTVTGPSFMLAQACIVTAFFMKLKLKVTKILFLFHRSDHCRQLRRLTPQFLR